MPWLDRCSKCQDSLISQRLEQLERVGGTLKIKLNIATEYVESAPGRAFRIGRIQKRGDHERLELLFPQIIAKSRSRLGIQMGICKLLSTLHRLEALRL